MRLTRSRRSVTFGGYKLVEAELLPSEFVEVIEIQSGEPDPSSPLARAPLSDIVAGVTKSLIIDAQRDLKIEERFNCQLHRKKLKHGCS